MANTSMPQTEFPGSTAPHEEKQEGMKERLQESAQAVGERAQEAAQRGREAVGKAQERVSEAARAARQYVEEIDYRELGENITNTIRRYPVASVLVGFGIGLLLSRLTRE